MSCILCCALLLAAEPVDLTTPRSHLDRGRYDEAAEWFEARPADAPRSATGSLLLAELQFQTGKVAEALQTLEEAITREPGQAVLLAHKARLLAFRGELAPAAAAAEAALAIEPNQPLARLVQADVWTATGKLQEASDGYRWFVRYYNQAQPTDAATLMVLGQGAAQYARWKGSAQIFDFLVNTLCADALKDDPDCWQAHQLAGELLLEKYNRAEGLPELQAGLAINPRAVDILLSLAAASLAEMQYDDAERFLQKALETHPRHPEALRLQAKSLISQGRIVEGEPVLGAALVACPTDQRTIALVAYLESVKGHSPVPKRLEQLLGQLDDLSNWQPSDSPFETIVVNLAKVNPRPGYFLQELGRLFQGQRKLTLAAICYEQAIARMPQLSEPKSDLAMLHFQAGRMEEARKLLDDAFRADPYHVRISNMRKVLRVLDDYATVSTPHFVLRADSQLDSVLSKYMAEELERVYADVTTEYGFEPPQRTQIEIYNKARGLAGHQWFSARMVGLPWLQTIGASTGLIIALTSPAATPEPYNWARVIRHEFVHVVTLQQTDFNIPHWFTEALATRAEGYPFPKSWDALLVKRFRANNLRNLDDLHLGFQRAESREDWDFAYCQSVLYAEYFLERFGDDALRKLLNAYRETRSTDEALQRAFGVRKADVEAGHKDFLQRRVDRLLASSPNLPLDAAAITDRYESDPKSPEVQADYAALLLDQEDAEQAEAIAATVLKSTPAQIRAACVLAEVRLQQKRERDALAILQRAYDPAKFDHRLWLLLGKQQLRTGDSQGAFQLFQRACEREPEELVWWQGLAQAADLTDNRAALIRCLETVARLDGDSAAARLERAELALEDKDFATAVDYAKRALQVDVLDADIHLTLARGFAGLKDTPSALAEYDVALQLKPGDARIQTERRQLAGGDSASK